MIKSISNSSIIQNQCQICTDKHVNRNEIVYILSETLYQLKQLSQSDEQIDFRHNSFIQLIKIIFSQMNDLNQKSFQCNHHLINNYYRITLQCDQNNFLKLCQRFSLKLVKRKYQLQIIKNMMKNIPNTIEKDYYHFDDKVEKQKLILSEQKFSIDRKNFNYIKQKQQPIKPTTLKKQDLSQNLIQENFQQALEQAPQKDYHEDNYIYMPIQYNYPYCYYYPYPKQ